jgi:hypothetical protein
VFAFGKMRENIIDSISKFLVSQTQKPTYVASMPECTYSPSSATILYGMTYNQAYTYDVASPMLYSAAYSEGATWVTRNIEYLKKLVCMPLSSGRRRFFLARLSSTKKDEQ